MSSHFEAHSEHAEGEESYFISMTDIMVGMLFVFIILLMFFVFRIQNTSEPTVPLSEHKSVLEQRDRALSRVKELEAELNKLKENPLEKYLKSAEVVRQGILSELKVRMTQSGIKDDDVRIIPEQGILRLSGDMLFPKGVSSIVSGSPSDVAVKSVARALAAVLPCFSLGPASNPTKNCNPNAAFIDAVFVEGHTDNSPIRRALEAGVNDNLSLSARRALNTMAAIYGYEPQLNQMFSISPSQAGLGLGQGNSPLINMSAFGETRPVSTNDTAEGQASNRRIDIRILMYSPRTDNLDAVRRLVGG